MLAIGPDGEASVDYLKKIPGAFWINDVNSIKNVIEGIIDKKSILVKNANKVREFAVRHHDKDSTRSKLLAALKNNTDLLR